MRRTLFLALSMAVLPLIPTTAQESTPTSATSRGWYVGAEGGVPFGFGSFSSFGHDKTHIGYNAGVFGGYRFNPVISAELSAKWGQTNLSAHDCCVDAGYWLGVDDIRYLSPVYGLDGWNYADLKSRVSLQQYGARLNINLLGFFSKTKSSRWTLDVSPAVYAVGTKAELQTLAEGNKAMSYDQKWHFGYGGRVQAGYMLTRNLGVGIYSEFTALTGSQLDGISEIRHDDNFVLESGVRVAWSFGKSNKKKAVEAPIDVVPSTPEPVVSPEESKHEIADNEAKAIDTVVVIPATPTPVSVKDVAITFPDVYFAFNSHSLSTEEQSKMETILEVLNQHPDMEIILNGWCDKSGRNSVNKRISLRRAEAVKTWLVKHGIVAQRISTVGNGSDHDATDNTKARRVMIEKR